MNRGAAYKVPKKEQEKKNAKILTLHNRPSARAVKRRTASAFAQTVSRALAIAAVLFLVCATIYTGSEITRMNDLLSKEKKQYEQLKTEKIRLNMELENKVSFNHIEEAAKEMGMRKKDYRRVNYIRLGDSDRVVTIQPSPDSLTADKQ
ncbi:MAG: hypothetical protein LBQ48_03865 [Oscillospiraceae bacterium]|jgi:cell division protein FtsL|nr:hypothetical protein [Oscillospiraceae bacterium]